jgi:hypothetical protein
MKVVDDKKLVRAIIRQVHPDLFTAHPYERTKNSESLKVGVHRGGDVQR